jgi:hypothetical protein
MPARRAAPRPLARRVRRAAALLALATLACNRGPALEAIAAAEQALAAAPELAEYEPEQRAAIEQALSDARASFEAGRYTDALRAAQTLPDEVAAARQSAGRRRQQVEMEWRSLSAELPARLEPLRARVAALEAAGVAAERLAPAQSELAALAQSLAAAQAAFERGELAEALAAAREAKARSEVVAGRLGVKPPASPAPARAMPP